MSRIQTPPPGRLVVSVLYSSIDALADSLKLLERHFGRVQCETTEIECSDNTYSEEMGQQLWRRFFSFERIVARDSLPEIKATCHKIEEAFGDRVDDYTFRTVNLDPGILTPENLVMASHRDFNNRIYLGKGVFAELTLIYGREGLTRLPWTNPDFCTEESVDFFLRVRETFSDNIPVRRLTLPLRGLQAG